MLTKLTTVIVVVFTIVGTLALRVSAAERPQHPNIVFVYADDWRWDCLGVVQREQGDRARFPWLQTPRLDELAKQSVRFRESFVVNSLCSPGRACVLTGRYSHLNGIISNRQPMPVDTPNFAKQLQAAGYATAYFGKYHMDSQRERPGFDFVASFIGQGKYNDCPILLNGTQTLTHGWIDDVSTDYAIKFLGDQPKDKPFFLWIGLKSAHGPRGGTNLPERFRGMYADEVSRDVPNLDVPAIFNSDKKQPAEQPNRRKQQREAQVAYMQHISAVDECVGRVLDGLEQSGHTKDTVVIIGSDNGYYLGEHRLGDKRSAYDESLRVPLLIRMPGESARRGTTSDAFVLNVDYAPTILDLAGAASLPDVQGRSLKSLLAGDTPSDWRTAFFYEYFKEPNFASPTVLAVRTASHKLITYPGHEEWTEVFDLVNDPYETKNLVADQMLLKHLREVFEQESHRVEFKMPTLKTGDGPAANRRGGKRRIAE